MNSLFDVCVQFSLLTYLSMHLLFGNTHPHSHAMYDNRDGQAVKEATNKAIAEAINIEVTLPGLSLSLYTNIPRSIPIY